MCFEFDALPPELPDGRAVIAGGAAAESLTMTSADGTEFAAALAESPEPSGPGVVDPARRPRPLPLLRRAGRALRRGGPRRDRLRLLRPHRRRRGARRGLRLDAARQTDLDRDHPDRPRRRPRGARRAHRRDPVRLGRLLLRRQPLVLGGDATRTSGSTRWSASTAGSTPPAAVPAAGPGRARRPDQAAGARPLRRRRRHIPPRTAPPSTAASSGPGSNTRSSSTRAPRTRSSTANRRSSPRPRPTPGRSVLDFLAAEPVEA